jgi:leader peptidase (prepilin peptidase)/N-methyltransferase
MIDARLFTTLVAALFGAVIGSFLNVVIFRLPRRIPFVRGRSCCPHCGGLIRWWQNIPILSFLLLRGKCSHCGDPISPRYPLVELLTAAAFAGWVYRSGPTLEAAGYVYLTSVLICVLFIDWEFKIIPDRLTLPSLAIGLLWAAFTPLGLLPSLLGAAVGGGGLLLVALLGDWIFRKESMGGGDIKLAAVLGAFLGWRLVVLVFFLSALIGAVVSIIWLLVSREMREKRLIPFGPFLALAAVVAAVWGADLVRWYVQTFWAV